MKMHLFFLLFFILNLNQLFSETIIIDNKTDIYQIGLSLYYLEDKDKKLSYEDLEKPEVKQTFTKSKAEIPNFGYTTSVYWFFFSYESETDLKDYIFEIAYPILDNIDLYYTTEEGKITHKKGGDNYIFAQREIEHRNFLFSMKDMKKKGILVIRMQTEGSLQAPITIYNQKYFWEKEQIDLSIQMVFVGIMLAMILYNFLLGVSLKDKTYLYYVFYLVWITLTMTGINGLSNQFLWRKFVYWNQISTPSSVILANVGAGLFLIYFLKLKINLPRFYKFYSAFVITNLLFFLSVFFVPYAFIGKMAPLLAIVSSIASFTVSLIVSIKGYRPAKIFLLAWSIFLLGALLMGISRFGIISINSFTENSVKIGLHLKLY